MKWFCNIFSLYLLILCGLPCNDGQHGHEQHTGANPTLTATTDHSTEHENCADACSPFCSCHCCSVTLLIRLLPGYANWKISPPAKKADFPGLSFFIDGVATAIDHPPQLV